MQQNPNQQNAIQRMLQGVGQGAKNVLGVQSFHDLPSPLEYGQALAPKVFGTSPFQQQLNNQNAQTQQETNIRLQAMNSPGTTPLPPQPQQGVQAPVIQRGMPVTQKPQSASQGWPRYQKNLAQYQ